MRSLRPYALSLSLLLLLPAFVGHLAPQAHGLGHVWSARYGDADYDAVRDIAVDSDGNVIVVGNFQGTINLGGGPLYSAGSFDIFLAKFDAAGNHLWSQSFGSAEADIAFATAVLSTGHILIGGYFNGSISFGGPTLVSAGSADAFIAKFWPSGAWMWSNRYGDAQYDVCSDVTHGSGGSTFAVGYFAGTIDFGQGVHTSNGDYDAWLIKTDGSSGTTGWSQTFGGAQNDVGVGIASTVNGRTVITGHSYGGIDFGGGPLTSAGVYDLFLAEFEAYGAYRWSAMYGGTGPDYGFAVARQASTDAVLLSGGFENSASFGGATLSSAGLEDIVFAKYDANGNHLWSQAFGGQSYDRAHGLATTLYGEVALTGYFYDTINFGGATHVTAGLLDAFIATFDITDGAYRSSLSAGDAASDNGRAIAYAPSMDLVAGGDFEGTIDLGGGPLSSAGGQDFYLVTYTDFSHIATGDPVAERLLLRTTPQPAMGATTIAYRLEAPRPITLELFTVDGRSLARVSRGPQSAGWHRLPLAMPDGAPLPGGVFFLQLSDGEQTVRERIVVLR